MTKEEFQGALILTGAIATWLGYHLGWRAGRRQMLLDIDRAQRIATILKE